MSTARYEELGRLFAGVLEQGLRGLLRRARHRQRTRWPRWRDAVSSAPVVVTGAALGLPGVDRVFDDENIARILDGQQFIDVIPHRFREAMVDKRITRLVKRRPGRTPCSRPSTTTADVIKLAGRGAPLDVVEEFGVEAARDAALDRTTRLAIGAGFDALRDAGIPLVMRYRTTSLGTMLPERWGLPESMRDDTGVIFASAFPGLRRRSPHDIEQLHAPTAGRREQLLALEAVRGTDDRRRARRAPRSTAGSPSCAHLLEAERFEFDRRFLFRVPGDGPLAVRRAHRRPRARTPRSTPRAPAPPRPCRWPRTGSAPAAAAAWSWSSADDVTSDDLLPWVGAGFLASGAAATDETSRTPPPRSIAAATG